MTTPSPDSLLAALADAPVIAILRGVTPETVLPVGRALAEAGVRFLEVPLNSPSPFESIRRLAQAENEGVWVGAGTVVRAKDVDAVAEAGGRYVLAPNTDPGVIRRTKALGLVSIPGFLTPTEAFAALHAGADALKLFPAGRLGAGYIRDLRAVLPAPIIAVGGVNADNLPEFLQNGACAVGVGSCLYRPDDPVADIAERARGLRATAAQFRRQS
jgi:2-dehydro-3-deoxyphosphogalactonate aldolase